MRIGLVVDSACDLPPAFIRENQIVVMPITVRVGQREFVDRRDPSLTRMFYREQRVGPRSASTAPTTVDAIRRLFLERLVIDYDYVVCLTIASSASQLYSNAVAASESVLRHYKPIRAAAGHRRPFGLRIVDSGNYFAGQGVLAAEVAAMIAAGDSPYRIGRRLDELLPNLYGYLLPESPQHLRAQRLRRGRRDDGWLQNAIGRALDVRPLIRGYRNSSTPVARLRHRDDAAARCFRFLVARIRAGLAAPTMCLSFAGDLVDLKKLPAYDELERAAQRANIELHESVMSMTGRVNVGEGGLGFGFCSDPHAFG